MPLLSFYTDEHISRAVVRGLRARGLTVVTALEAAGLGAKDAEHLRAAASTGRVLVTQDTDFLRLWRPPVNRMPELPTLDTALGSAT